MPCIVDFVQEHKRTLLSVGLAVVVARKVVPQLRPIAKAAIKGFLRARDTVSNAGTFIADQTSSLMPGGGE